MHRRGRGQRGQGRKAGGNNHRFHGTSPPGRGAGRAPSLAGARRFEILGLRFGWAVRFRPDGPASHQSSGGTGGAGGRGAATRIVDPSGPCISTTATPSLLTDTDRKSTRLNSSH